MRGSPRWLHRADKGVTAAWDVLAWHNAERIVEVFVGRARRHDLPPRDARRADIVDDLLHYVRELALAYQLGDADRSEDVAKAHGGRRWYAGYDLRSLLLEYGILRAAIGDVVEQSGYQMTSQEPTANPSSPRSWDCSKSTELRLHGPGHGTSGGANARRRAEVCSRSRSPSPDCSPSGYESRPTLTPLR